MIRLVEGLIVAREEHLSGAGVYWVVSPCPYRRRRVGGGLACRWGAAGRHRPRRRAGPGALSGARALAQADRDPRPIEDPARCGGLARARRGLPGRRRGAARRSGAVRPGGFGPDDLAADQLAGRRCDRATAAIDAARAAARRTVW